MQNIAPAAARVKGACIAFLAAAALTPATASAEPDAFPGAVPGMSSPSGIVQTPDGSIWVADDGQGLCRVAFDAQPRLVASAWCQPEAEDEDAHPEAPHDEGELIGDPLVADPTAVPGTRPGAIAGLAFDPSTSNFYAADVASGAGGVWRIHLDDSGELGAGQLIAAAGVRVQSVALAPPSTPGAEPDVIFLTKRGGALMRIATPATAPAYPQRIRVVGDQAEVGGMVATEDHVYLADGGVLRVPLNDDAASGERLPGFGDISVSSVAVDTARGRVYAGSSNLNGEDVVKVLDLQTGQAEPYEVGFEAVTAMMLDGDGRLVVTDDPSVAKGVEMPGLARMWRTGVQPLDRPQTRITAAPRALSNAATVTFAYESRAGAGFECRIDDGPYEECTGAGSGQRSYTGLADGEHRFWVRAKDSLTGLPVNRRFRIDRTPPEVRVVLSVTDLVEGDPAPRLRFATYEYSTTYTCSLDGAPYAACGWEDAIGPLSAGEHVLRVIATDAAGNSTAATPVTIQVRARPAATPLRPAVTPRAAPPAPARAAAPAPAAAVAGNVAASPDRGPIFYPFTLRYRSTAAPVRFGLRVPPTATNAQIAVKNWLGRTVVRRTVKLRPGTSNRINLRLTRSEQRAMRPGRYLVTAVLTTAKGTKGNPQTHWMRIKPTRR